MEKLASILNLITSASTCVCDLFKTKIEKNLENEIVKEKRQLKLAANIAEKMIKISMKYINNFTKKDKKRFINLYKKFERFD